MLFPFNTSAKGADAASLLLLFDSAGAANVGAIATDTQVKIDPSNKDTIRPV